METPIASTVGTPSVIRQHYYGRKIKLYLFVIVVMTAFMAFYGVEKYLELSEKKTIASQSDNFLQELEPTRQKEREVYLQIQEHNEETVPQIEKEILAVFPGNEQYTELTRLLDAFFKKHHRTKDPMIATDLQFDKPFPDESKRYLILPFSITIESSEDNFYRFLAFVDSSGTLAGKIRLMDIQSIQLNFPSEEEEEDQSSAPKKKIGFSAKLHAYSQFEEEP